MPDVDLIAEVLDQHHVSVDWFRRRDGWAWWCSCLTDGEDVHPDGDSARSAAARHQAEQIAEAIRHGAPEVPSADPGTSVDEQLQPVPAAVEVAQ